MRPCRRCKLSGATRTCAGVWKRTLTPLKARCAERDSPLPRHRAQSFLSRLGGRVMRNDSRNNCSRGGFIPASYGIRVALPAAIFVLPSPVRTASNSSDVWCASLSNLPPARPNGVGRPRQEPALSRARSSEPRLMEEYRLAERGGFEPPVRFNPYNGLANRRFRPLSHLSIL